MTDFLNDTVSGLRSRLKELRDEAERIERALSALEGGSSPRRGPGRPKKSGSSPPSAGGSRRRRRKGGTRAQHVSKLLAQSPDGLTVPEIADGLKIKPNYVYRVLAEMDKDGLIRKDGRTVHAA